MRVNQYQITGYKYTEHIEWWFFSSYEVRKRHKIICIMTWKDASYGASDAIAEFRLRRPEYKLSWIQYVGTVTI